MAKKLGHTLRPDLLFANAHAASCCSRLALPPDSRHIPFFLLSSILQKIPCLNDVDAMHIRPGTVVKYRCMVQDLFDPEYYLGVYEHTAGDGTVALRSGRYRVSI